MMWSLLYTTDDLWVFCVVPGHFTGHIYRVAVLLFGYFTKLSDNYIDLLASDSDTAIHFYIHYV